MGLRRRRFSLLFSLLMPACSLPSAPPLLTGMASTLNGTLSYHVSLFYTSSKQSSADYANAMFASAAGSRRLAPLSTKGARAYRRGKLSVSVAVGTLFQWHIVKIDTSRASVYILAPLYFRRRIARPVSCYAFFKGWLLLSQPPGCLSRNTSFST